MEACDIFSVVRRLHIGLHKYRFTDETRSN